jgi:hypothetical protein
MSRKDMEAKIVATAWQDEGFRKRPETDPKGLFEERLGIKLPASLKISIHEETDNSLHFVIPAKPKTTASELSDQELERVAGGASVSNPFDQIRTVQCVSLSLPDMGPPTKGW